MPSQQLVPADTVVPPDATLETPPDALGPLSEVPLELADEPPELSELPTELLSDWSTEDATEDCEREAGALPLPPDPSELDSWRLESVELSDEPEETDAPEEERLAFELLGRLEL